ncbi:hypothetical protein RB195_015083 [Necator americanus]|uniref:Uncharacterized protein n=1 Tax=Necator americanus TaxID=51031 RepID=A0ABR1E464_NECAM
MVSLSREREMQSFLLLTMVLNQEPYRLAGVGLAAVADGIALHGGPTAMSVSNAVVDDAFKDLQTVEQLSN